MEEIEKKYNRLLEIVIKLRHWTKEWNRIYGKETRDNKQQWEKRADKFIEENNQQESN